MAVDKEALICLSRVYSYYFKCNFPLFYVYPALTRYLSILLLNILTLLACTHSSDNLFHTLMVLCENENFLTSNLLCFSSVACVCINFRNFIMLRTNICYSKNCIFHDFGILDLRTTEPFRSDSRSFFSNLRTFGLKNLRTEEPSNLRTFGLIGCNCYIDL